MSTARWSGLRNLLRRWSRDWGGVLVLGQGAFVLLYIAWWWFRWGPAELKPLFADLAFLPGSLITTVLSFRASRQQGSPLRKAYRFASMAQGAWFAGNLLWVYFRHVAWGSPYTGLTYLFYLACFPLMLAALFAMPSPPDRTPGERLRSWLDNGTMMLAGWMVIWFLVIGPGLWNPNADPLVTGVLLINPLGDLLLLFGVVSLLVRWRGGRHTATLAVLAGGILLFVIAGVGLSYETMRGAYEVGGWPDLFAIASTLFLAVSAQVHQDAEMTALPAVPEPRRRPFLFLPYAAVAVGLVFLVIVAYQQGLGRFTSYLGMAVAVTVLVLIRQILMLLDNERLLEESRTLTADLQRSEERFRRLVQNSSDVITVMDVGGKVLDQTPSIERVFGYQPGELVGQGLRRLIHPDDIVRALAFLREVATGGGDTRVVEVRFRHKDGTWRHAATTFTSLLHDPNVRGLVLNTRDITERKSLEEQLRHLAFHDPLTGLANRLLFRQHVEEALTAAQRSGARVSVLFLDLDGFKTVNDSLGHDAGDELLWLVAERLRRSLDRRGQVARLGGDEFGILLEKAVEADAIALAGRIMAALEQPFTVKGKDVFVRTSLGIAVNVGGTALADELLRNADVAMYKAKGAGPGRYALFEPSMHEEAMRRLELEADLRRAVEHGEFALHYQPTVDLKSGRVVGVEALLRWRHPERGLVLPAEFIPLAEETGLILPIGRWVMLEACTQAKVWHDRYPTDPPLSISINLSGKQIQHPDLVQEMKLALEASGLAPAHLVAEITESVLMQNPDGVINRLHELKRLGIRLAADDFGTGYSSLSYLQRFPVDIVKIDRSFVRDLGQGRKHKALARGITDLANALELQTVAEGIEEEWQVGELRQLECQLGQGYYFARPVAPNEIDELLERAQQEISLGGRK